jgi:hypothetical protein
MAFRNYDPLGFRDIMFFDVRGADTVRQAAGGRADGGDGLKTEGRGVACAVQWGRRMCLDPGRPRRDVEQEVVHRVLGEHLTAFEEVHGGRLPAHVMAELRAALRCGVFEEGVACFACDGCGARTFVPLSCKRRGFCPGCCGRRMADIAAHLCDRVLPKVAYRQWVLSVPVGVRYLALRHRRLARRVLGVGG